MLLQVKCRRPAPRGHEVLRAEVNKALDEVLAYPLTLVVAPAGYGKTTSVAAWLAQSDLPSAWLQLDGREDSNPAIFWRYFYASLGQVMPELLPEVAYLLASPELLADHAHLRIFLDKVLDRQDELVVVLDDVHLLKDQAEIFAGLSYLVDYLAPKVHLIILSREQPPMEVAKLAAKSKLLRLGPAALRFADDEIAEFFQLRGQALPPEQLAQLAIETQGWAAALVTMAMGLKDGKTNSLHVTAVKANSNDLLQQYLEGEIISHWSRQERAFAYQLALLEPIDIDLACFATDEADARRKIITMAEGNAFLVAIDLEQKHFRYHTLLQVPLLQMGRREFPHLAKPFYRRAAAWCLEQQNNAKAIDYLLLAEEHAEATSLVEEYIGLLAKKQADFARVMAWIKQLPLEYLQKSPKIAGIHVLYFISTNQYSIAWEWLDRIMEAYKNSGATIYSENYLQILGGSLVLKAYLQVIKGELDKAMQTFSLLKEECQEGFRMSYYTDFNQADVYYYRCPIGGMVNLMHRNPQGLLASQEIYNQLLSIKPGYDTLGWGEYYYETDRLDLALPQLLQAMEEARLAGSSGVLFPVMVDIARLYAARGDFPSAWKAMAEGEAVLKKIGRLHWLELLKAFAAYLSIREGRAEQAMNWLAQCRLDVYEPINRANEFPLLVYARTLLAAGQLQDALLLLRRLRHYTQQEERWHSLVEILNLLAIAASDDAKAGGEACQLLQEAMLIGIKHNYLRSFLDEGEPLIKIITRCLEEEGLLANKELFEYARLLQQHWLSGGAERASLHHVNSTWEALTLREREVAVLLLEAKSNQEIAETMGISLRTVKAHTGNIYSKLGVKTRMQCLRLLRQKVK